MLYRLLTVLTTSACFGGVVHAQEVPAKLAANAAAPDLLADDVAKFGAMFKRGFFDEIISNVNQKIETLPADARDSPDPRLLYFRGLARYKLGWLDGAKADMLVAQQADVGEVGDGWSAGWVLSFIKKRALFVPPQMEELRDGERVMFRMHTSDLKENAELVRTLLAEVYRANRQVVGQDVEATTVYVFENYQQFVDYYKAFFATAGPNQWSAASARGNILFVTLRDSEGVLRARDDRQFFKALVDQEYNLVLRRRMRGENAPVGPSTQAVAPDALADDLAKFGTMFERGFYDELIFNVNQKIEALLTEQRATPDPRLLYFRGLSYYKLGWFPEAKADLLVAQQAGLSFLPGGFGVKWALNYIEERTPLLPSQVEEIRDGERVTFRMHNSGMEGGTVMVMAMLPEAYRISRAMFGSDTAASTVYVFEDYQQFLAYYKKVYEGKNPGSWYAALAQQGVMWISLRDTEDVLRAREDRVAFKTTVVHEFNHAMLSRLMGRTVLPRWFVEGLAQVAGAQVNPTYDSGKQRTLKRLFANNALLPIDKLDDYESFAEQTELGISMRKEGERAGAPDPYAQGYGMTKYLLDNISTAQLQNFLNRVRETDDFKTSFGDEFGFSLDQFYQGWKADTARRLATQ